MRSMSAFEEEALILLLRHQRGGGSDPFIRAAVECERAAFVRCICFQHKNLVPRIRHRDSVDLNRRGWVKPLEHLSDILQSAVVHELANDLSVG